MTAHLLTNAEFRRIRDELAHTARLTRLPQLEREIAALEAVVKPVIHAMQMAGSKHERDKIYARLEQGEDWRLQWLTFERDAIIAKGVGG